MPLDVRLQSSVGLLHVIVERVNLQVNVLEVVRPDPVHEPPDDPAKQGYQGKQDGEDRREVTKAEDHVL